MRKNIIYVVSILLFLVFFSSCNEETRVEISVTPGYSEASPGSKIIFNYLLTPDIEDKGELGDFYIYSDSEKLFSEKFSGSTIDSGTFEYTVPSNAKNNDIISLTFKAVDGKSGIEKTTNASIQVNVSDAYLSLYITPRNPSAMPGDVIEFNYVITPDVIEDGQLGDFYVEKDGNVIFNKIYSGTSSISDIFEYTVPTNANEGDVIVLTFKAIDGISGNETTVNANINIQNYPEIVESTGNTVNYNSTSTTTEFGWQLESTAKGVVITQVDSDDADLVYFWNDTYRQQLLSPDAQQIMQQEPYSNWSYSLSGKKTTKIQTATISDWDNASCSTIDNINITYSETHPGGGNGIDHVADGEYYIFELDDGRKGILKVSGSDVPYKYKKGEKIESSITLDFKFQAIAYNADK